MQEYEDMGHMNKVENNEEDKLVYYMPHYAVIKDGSQSTKL